MTIYILPQFEGRLLRSYLTHTLSLSTGTLAKLKAHDRGITVNGQHVTVRYVLHAGDCLELAMADTPDIATKTVFPAEGALHILYEDDHLIVFNKPAGMPTHPSHGHLTDTLANALAYRYEQAGIPFVFRPLGRLDRNTSGVVVASKTQAVSGFLGGAMCRHEIAKRYLAILEGVLPFDGLIHEINVPILPPAKGVVMRTTCAEDTPGAATALTQYRVLATSPSYTLVLAMPLTGRTHQLRVHFAHIGHPLVGDDIYGYGEGSQGAARMPRHALHALSLSLPQPFVFSKTTGLPSKENALPTDCLDASTPLNFPSEDGWLHTWATLPEDMEHLIKSEFGDSLTGYDNRTPHNKAPIRLPDSLFVGGEPPMLGHLRQLMPAASDKVIRYDKI